MLADGKDGATTAVEEGRADGRRVEGDGLGFGREADAAFARIPTRFFIGACGDFVSCCAAFSCGGRVSLTCHDERRVVGSRVLRSRRGSV